MKMSDNPVQPIEAWDSVSFEWLSTAMAESSDRQPNLESLRRVLRQAEDPWANWLRQAVPPAEKVSVPSESRGTPFSEDEVDDLSSRVADLRDGRLRRILYEAAADGYGTVTAYAVLTHLLLEEESTAASELLEKTPIRLEWGTGQVAELVDWQEFRPEKRGDGLLLVHGIEELDERIFDSLEIDSQAYAKSGFSADFTHENFRVISVKTVSAESLENALSIVPPSVRKGTWNVPLVPIQLTPAELETLLDAMEHVAHLRILIFGSELSLRSELGDEADQSSGWVEDGGSVKAVVLSHFVRRTRIAEAEPIVGDRPFGEDLLNTEPVAKALAWTLALKETSTPFCLGVFGSWGSGKSFLMRQIAAELREREERAPERLRNQFVETIRIVTFNAWTYAKGDLWSAILFELLTRLRQAADSSAETRLQQVSEASERLARSRALVDRLATEIEQLEVIGRARVESARRKESISSEKLGKLDKWSQVLSRELQAGRREALLAFGAKVFMPFSASRIVVLVGVLVGVVVAGLLLHEAVEEPLVSVAVPALVGFLTWIRKPVEHFRSTMQEVGKLQDEIESVFAEIRGAEEDLKEAWALMEDAPNLTQSTLLANKRNQLIAAEKQVEDAEEHLRNALVGMGRPPARRTLDQFLTERLGEGDYEERLGTLQRVESDLQELAVLFSQNRASDGSSGAGRVVLFIDDLDRCPPDRVVLVMEAIQLLLAENVYLETVGWPFVVVLGADTRILCRALETEYPGILDPKVSPSGADYLEKIVQLPYLISPVREQRYESFLSGLTGVSEVGAASAVTEESEPNASGNLPTLDSGPVAGEPFNQIPPIHWSVGGLRQVFDESDLAALQAYRELAPDNPRALKRLVNQYRFCKLMRLQFGTFDQAATAFLLSLVGGFRRAAREIISSVRRSPDASSLSEVIGSLLDSDRTSTQVQTGNSLYEELRMIQDVLKDLAVESPSVEKLSQVAPYVAPFCYVGDFPGA